jgi:hypothetical protein
VISEKDKSILQDLAKRVAEIGSLPIMEERRQMWLRHNRLERVRPLILVFPEGSWRELLPWESLQCVTEDTRRMEWELRTRIISHQLLHDDKPIEKVWWVSKVIRNSGWGLEPQRKPSTEPTGSWAFVPVILEHKDLEKLRYPEITYDAEATAAKWAEAEELFGGILDLQLKGAAHVSFHLMSTYVFLRGLEQVMWDMYDNPAMLHEAMAFLEEGNRRTVQQYIDQNLLSLNNDGTYHSSGGLGYSSELPKPDYDPARIRPCDMWSSAEAQEMATVSPKQHDEFILQYEKRLLAPFGLNGYGCCEDLTEKLDDVLTIPNIRRVSIAPLANVDRCANKIGNKAIFSWKPQPSHLVGEFDRDFVRGYIKHTLDVTKGGVVEMILKDTHTCQSHPERFTMWTDIAQDLAARS